VEITRFTVFNRWGEIVYNNENPGVGWDGTHGGEQAPADVYVYIIDVKTPDGVIHPFRGDLTLIR